jgi:hypothetical protein
MVIVGKNGSPISSVDEWYTGAPPKGREAHWVPGRSARELANAWCGPTGACLPPEIGQLLRSHPDLVELVIERAFPERQIRFDERRGEPRNADLAIEARDCSGIVGITIEGKADETFDRTVTAVLEAGVQRIAGDERTGAILRVEALATALLPPWREGLSHLGDLRYQLLTAIAGTLAWAREVGGSRAVFVVHEFVTDQTSDRKHDQNATDLNRFLERVSDGSITNLPDGVLVGPLNVPGDELMRSVRSISERRFAEHVSRACPDSVGELRIAYL